MILIFVSILDLSFTNWIKERNIEINKGVILSTSVLTVFMLLASILFPYFSLITTISQTIDFQPSAFIITALPLGICYLVILIGCLLTKNYFSTIYQKLMMFSEKITPHMRKIYGIEFIFTPLIYVSKKLIIPSMVWFYEKIFLWLIIGLVTKNIVRFLKFCILKIRILILDYVIPGTKVLFTKMSLFSRKFEEASQRSQLLIALSFLLILLLIVVGLFAGGKI